ncbi:MAG: hypothetical protein FWH29_06895 [Methanobrevibacter sp.]|nr:hypothetical protein [Methanobrevibacter sp.]
MIDMDDYDENGYYIKDKHLKNTTKTTKNNEKVSNKEKYGKTRKNFNKRVTNALYICPNCGVINSINEYALKNQEFMCRSCHEPFNTATWKKKDKWTKSDTAFLGFSIAYYIGAFIIVLVLVLFLFVFL